MRLVWLTDIHLNFLNGPALGAFMSKVIDRQPDAVLITGDIAEGHNLHEYLSFFEEAWNCPTFIVLGNHDYYKSSILTVREYLKELTLSGKSKVTWLNVVNHIELTSQVALVGHDGWADARLGDFWNSKVWLADFKFISDFIGLNKPQIQSLLEKLGDEAASHFERVLPEAMEKYPLVLVMTHVPPFKEATWHEGKISDDNWLPFFSCKAVGEVLKKMAQQYPNSHLRVLCGHTHGDGYVKILDNLEVYTGHAEYRAPEIQKVFTILKP